MSNRKREIVEGLVAQLPESRQETVEEAMVSWWVNLRESGGLRLTYHGYHTLHNILEVESWSVDIGNAKQIMTKKVILDLDRKLTWPYYIDPKLKRIVFFSSREAMMATLYGDLQSWLANHAPR